MKKKEKVREEGEEMCPRGDTPSQSVLSSQVGRVAGLASRGSYLSWQLLAAFHSWNSMAGIETMFLKALEMLDTHYVDTLRGLCVRACSVSHACSPPALGAVCLGSTSVSFSFTGSGLHGDHADTPTDSGEPVVVMLHVKYGEHHWAFQILSSSPVPPTMWSLSVFTGSLLSGSLRLLINLKHRCLYWPGFELAEAVCGGPLLAWLLSEGEARLFPEDKFCWSCTCWCGKNVLPRAPPLLLVCGRRRKHRQKRAEGLSTPVCGACPHPVMGFCSEGEAPGPATEQRPRKPRP